MNKSVMNSLNFWVPGETNTDMYEYYSNDGARGQCGALDGLAFPAAQLETGVNAPPLHPNCNCTLKYYEIPEVAHGVAFDDNPSGIWEANDWMFYGRTGDEYDPNPEFIYTDRYFGQRIDPEDSLNLHVVDWIARLIFHEDSTPEAQAAIAWCIFNRYIIETGYTSQNAPHTLINILTSPRQLEAFLPEYNTNPQAPNFHRPLEWCQGYPMITTTNVASMDAWDNALRLAKLVVSIYGNPYLSKEHKLSLFERAVPCPFPEYDAFGNPVRIYEVTSFFSLAAPNASLPIALGTGNKFGYAA